MRNKSFDKKNGRVDNKCQQKEEGTHYISHIVVQNDSKARCKRSVAVWEQEGTFGRQSTRQM